jgi:nicotinamide-nucleotide amidase
LGQVDVRITARASTEGRAAQMLDDVAMDLRARLGDFVYAEGEVTLEAVVVEALRNAGICLALIETNTGGDLAQRLAAAPGADQSLCYAGLVGALDDLAPEGPSEIVSAAAAEWAAQEVLSKARSEGATHGLAVLGTRDPAAGPYGIYRGETYVGLAAGDSVLSMRIDTGGTDELARRWVGNGALNWLRLWLAGKV